MRMQKTWQKFTVLNIGMALGLFASLFWIPKTTSILLLVVVFGAVVAVMNYLAFTRLRRVPGGESTRGKSFSTIIAVAVFLIFVLDLIFRLAHHSP